MQPLPGTDGDLWRSAVAGDRDAYAQLYRRHTDRVFTHCVRRCGSDHDAADLTGQVFADTWARRSMIELDESGVLPWLLGTANNLLKGHHRAAAHRNTATAALAAERFTTDSTTDIVDRLDADQLMRQVRTAIATLKPADQDIVWLCSVEGLPPTVVATQLGIPAGTVRSRLSRALKQLRFGLQPLQPTQPTSATEVSR